MPISFRSKLGARSWTPLFCSLSAPCTGAARAQPAMRLANAAQHRAAGVGGPFCVAGRIASSSLSAHSGPFLSILRSPRAQYLWHWYAVARHAASTKWLGGAFCRLQGSFFRLRLCTAQPANLRRSQMLACRSDAHDAPSKAAVASPGRGKGSVWQALPLWVTERRVRSIPPPR